MTTSLHPYLEMRKKYNEVLSNIDFIIHNHDDLLQLNDEINNKVKKDIDDIQNSKTDFTDLKNKIKQLKDNISIKIYALCQHEFIDDCIDIDPDYSQNIRYCIICEYCE